MKEKSFWSSVPGMITAIAGLLTGTAAAVGLLFQLGVLGDKDSSSVSDGSAASEEPASESDDSPATSSSAVTPTFTVEPTSLVLDQLLAKQAKLVVKNTGETSMSVETPVLRGGDAGQFAVRDISCTDAKIPAAETCEMEVTFTPKASGRYSATLVVSVDGASRTSEVALRGSSVL